MFLEKYPPKADRPVGEKKSAVKTNGRMARFDPSWAKKRTWLPGVDSNHQPPGP